MVCTISGGTSYPERKMVDRSSVTQTWYSLGAVIMVVEIWWYYDGGGDTGDSGDDGGGGGGDVASGKREGRQKRNVESLCHHF